MKSLLIYRNYLGLGDWIMTMTVIKLINKQFPDIKVYLNVKVRKEEMPPFILSVIKHFDVHISGLTRYNFPQNEEDNYDMCTGHFVYPNDWPDKHLIEGMIHSLKQSTGISLKYKPDVLAQYKGEYHRGIVGKYVIMPSQGKERGYTGKEWAKGSFDKLSTELSDRGITVVQMAGLNEKKLLGADAWCSDPDIELYHTFIVRARLVVGIVNGLIHYSGHHRIPTLVLQLGQREKPNWTRYPKQIRIMGLDIPVDTVRDKVLELIKEDK